MKALQFLAIIFFTVSFSNCAQEDKIKPTVYTVGDSTVKNGKGDGYGGLWGWGDFMDQFLSDKVLNDPKYKEFKDVGKQLLDMMKDIENKKKEKELQKTIDQNKDKAIEV